VVVVAVVAMGVGSILRILANKPFEMRPPANADKELAVAAVSK
jgi:hypothetical protein